MALSTKISEKDAQQFADEIRAAGLDAPWLHPGPLIQPKKFKVQSGLWKWDKIEPVVRGMADFIAPGKDAERRIVRIANPGVPELTATHTISIAFQYLLPGEVAPAHRHSPNAMRFMIDGEGAYTTVNGDKCMMHPGDLILTPAGDWHDHGNEGTGPVMWMDILDSPVVRFLETLTMESYPHEKQLAGSQNGRSERLFSAPGLVPAGHASETPSACSPIAGSTPTKRCCALPKSRTIPLTTSSSNMCNPLRELPCFPASPPICRCSGRASRLARTGTTAARSILCAKVPEPPKSTAPAITGRRVTCSSSRLPRCTNTATQIASRPFSL